MLANVQRQFFNNAPSLLRPPLALMPFSLQKRILEHTLKSLFAGAKEDGDLDFLSNRYLEIKINDLGLRWFISFDNGQLVVCDKLAATQSCDVSFSANGDDLVLIADRKEDPDTLFFQRRLMIEGDTELGLEVKNLIDSVELDKLPTWVNSFVHYCAENILKRNAQSQ